MAMTHEQIDEQMVDFLYGELPADARAAFEAHVAGCERCRREVESFGRVRAVARTLLDEAPPARAHDAILRAAREAAAAAPASAAAAAAIPALAPAKKTDTASAKKAEPARASLWDWLRARWAFPTLATVAALTVFILGSRLFLNPNTVREMARPAVSEPPASAPAGTPPAPGEPAANAPAAASEAQPSPAATVPAEASPATPSRRKAFAEAKKARSEAAHHAAPAAASGGAGSGRVGAPAKDDPLDGLIGPPADKAAKSAKRDVSDELDRIAGGGPARDKAPATGGGKGYAQPPPAAEKPLANLSQRAGKKKAIPEMEEREEPRARLKKEAPSDELLEGAGRAYAQPPPPAQAPAPRYAEAPSPPAAQESESALSDDSPAPAKAAPAPQRVAPRSLRRGEAEPAPAPPPQPAPVTAARARSSDDAMETGEAEHETLLQRADRLFTQGRWAEAAIAYRDLLRQHPNSPNAERWRRRLAAARAAVATGRPPPPSAR